MTKILTDAARAKLTDQERVVAEQAEEDVAKSYFGGRTIDESRNVRRLLMEAINRLAAQEAPTVTAELTETEAQAFDLMKKKADANALYSESNEAVKVMCDTIDRLRKAQAPPPAPPAPQGLTDEERDLVTELRRRREDPAWMTGTDFARLLTIVDKLSAQPPTEPKPAEPFVATPEQLARLGRIRQALKLRQVGRYSAIPFYYQEDGKDGYAVLWGDLELLLTLLDAPRSERAEPWPDYKPYDYVEKEPREKRLATIRDLMNKRAYDPSLQHTRLWSDLEYLLKLAEQPQPAPAAKPKVTIYWHGCRPKHRSVCLGNTSRAAVYKDGELAALVEADDKRLSWTSSVLGLVIGETNVEEFVLDDVDMPDYDVTSKTYSGTPARLSDLRAHLDHLSYKRRVADDRITELEAELAKLKQERETWTTKT